MSSSDGRGSRAERVETHDAAREQGQDAGSDARTAEGTKQARDKADGADADDPTRERAQDDEKEAIERRRNAEAAALTLEIVGDLPHADIKPPENVLFVCKLNPVTRSEDLELIFSRFGEIRSCEVIRDKKVRAHLLTPRRATVCSMRLSSLSTARRQSRPTPRCRTCSSTTDASGLTFRRACRDCSMCGGSAEPRPCIDRALIDRGTRVLGVDLLPLHLVGNGRSPRCRCVGGGVGASLLLAHDAASVYTHGSDEDAGYYCAYRCGENDVDGAYPDADAARPRGADARGGDVCGARRCRQWEHCDRLSGGGA